MGRERNQNVHRTLCNRNRRLLRHCEMSDKHEVDYLSRQADHFGVSKAPFLQIAFGLFTGKR
jgi:hypothetical protein